MKKTILFLLTGLCAAVCAQSTETLSLFTDGAFHKGYGQGWWLNRGVSPKAKAGIVKEGSNSMLKIEVGEKGTAHVCSDHNFELDRKGTLHFSIRVKGEGVFTCGFYAYTGKGRFISSYTPKSVQVKSAGWTALQFNYPLANVRKDAVKGKIVLFQTGEGTIFADDFQCTMTRPAE